MTPNDTLRARRIKRRLDARDATQRQTERILTFMGIGWCLLFVALLLHRSGVFF